MSYVVTNMFWKLFRESYLKMHANDYEEGLASATISVREPLEHDD
jgi:hypothetical protein